MTQIQKIASIYTIAAGMIICSFFTWSSFIAANFFEEETQELSVVLHTEDRIKTDQNTYPKALTTKIIEEQKEKNEFSMQYSDPDIFVSELDNWELKKKYALSIPSLGIHTPVLVPSKTFWNMRQWEMLEEQMQIGMTSGAVAYPHSSAPGSRGALIVAGHSSPPTERAARTRFGTIFEKLPSIESGEKMMVTSNGVTTVYQVTGSVVVPNTDTSILAQDTSESVLKLITCFPVGSTKDRMVITAHKIES